MHLHFYTLPRWDEVYLVSALLAKRLLGLAANPQTQMIQIKYFFLASDYSTGVVTLGVGFG